MSSAGRWNTTLDCGATWRQTLHYQDVDGVPITVQGPAVLEIRTRQDPNASLIARLDTTGTADGDISFGPDPGQVNLLIAQQDTEDLTPGSYYFDLFVSTTGGDLIRLVYGEIQIRPRVSSL